MAGYTSGREITGMLDYLIESDNSVSIREAHFRSRSKENLNFKPGRGWKASTIEKAESLHLVSPLYDDPFTNYALERREEHYDIHTFPPLRAVACAHGISKSTYFSVWNHMMKCLQSGIKWDRTWKICGKYKRTEMCFSRIYALYCKIWEDLLCKELCDAMPGLFYAMFDVAIQILINDKNKQESALHSDTADTADTADTPSQPANPVTPTPITKRKYPPHVLCTEGHMADYMLDKLLYIANAGEVKPDDEEEDRGDNGVSDEEEVHIMHEYKIENEDKWEEEEQAMRENGEMSEIEAEIEAEIAAEEALQPTVGFNSSDKTPMTPPAQVNRDSISKWAFETANMATNQPQRQKYDLRPRGPPRSSLTSSTRSGVTKRKQTGQDPSPPFDEPGRRRSQRIKARC